MIQIDPENKFSPLPKYLESYRDKITNFGLYYQKFAKYQRKRNFELATQHNWDNGKKWSLISNQFAQYKEHFSAATLEKNMRIKKNIYQRFQNLV